MLSNKELNELNNLQSKLFMAVFLCDLNSEHCKTIIKGIKELIKELRNVK